jgi:hypothetical protein
MGQLSLVVITSGCFSIIKELPGSLLSSLAFKFTTYFCHEKHLQSRFHHVC